MFDYRDRLTIFVSQLGSVFGSSIMKAVYGIDVKDMNDPYIHTAEQGLTALAEAAMPGRFLVDVFPWCMHPHSSFPCPFIDQMCAMTVMHVPAWFPGLEFKNWAAKASVFIRDTAQIPWNDMKTAIVRNWITFTNRGAHFDAEGGNSEALHRDKGHRGCRPG